MPPRGLCSCMKGSIGVGTGRGVVNTFALPWADTIFGPSLLEPPPVAAAASDVRHSKLLGTCPTVLPIPMGVAVLHKFDDFEERIRPAVGGRI